MATQRRPEYLQTLQDLRPGAGPPGAAQYTGQLRISRGKQPLCEATLPGLSPRGRTTRRLPVNWGLRILRENDRNLDCGDVPKAIPDSMCKCSI